jgi:predicted membrane channel-forming protein YqfA (hemolysin III family)
VGTLLAPSPALLLNLVYKSSLSRSGIATGVTCAVNLWSLILMGLGGVFPFDPVAYLCPAVGSAFFALGLIMLAVASFLHKRAILKVRIASLPQFL